MGPSMKRTFPLQVPGKNDDRVRDKIRHEINKYVRCELQRVLPKGLGRWELTCKVGASVAEAVPRTVKEIAGAIDALALTGATSVYVEIVSVAVARKSAAQIESEAAKPESPAPNPEG